MSGVFTTEANTVGCPYCYGEASLWWHKIDAVDNQDWLREAYVELDGTVSLVPPYDDDDFVSIKINFCPMCGSDLTGRDKIDEQNTNNGSGMCWV